MSCGRLAGRGFVLRGRSLPRDRRRIRKSWVQAFVDAHGARGAQQASTADRQHDVGFEQRAVDIELRVLFSPRDEAQVLDGLRNARAIGDRMDVRQPVAVGGARGRGGGKKTGKDEQPGGRAFAEG